MCARTKTGTRLQAQAHIPEKRGDRFLYTGGEATVMPSADGALARPPFRVLCGANVTSVGSPLRVKWTVRPPVDSLRRGAEEKGLCLLRQ